MKGLPLKAVAEPAEISAMYLQKLERGEVQDPSPHVLHRLSEQLGLNYAEAMRLAGYVRTSAFTRPRTICSLGSTCTTINRFRRR